jgi:hypothetical protein
MTVVYYRGPYAHITDDVMEVWSPGRRVFRIGELDSVYVLPGAEPRWTPLRVIPTVAVVLAVAVALLRRYDDVLAPLLIVAVASVVGVACLGGGGVPYELWAVHRGADVRLFRCQDAQMFGQVRRALLRAMEQHALK